MPILYLFIFAHPKHSEWYKLTSSGVKTNRQRKENGPTVSHPVSHQIRSIGTAFGCRGGSKSHRLTLVSYVSSPPFRLYSVTVCVCVCVCFISVIEARRQTSVATFITIVDLWCLWLWCGLPSSGHFQTTHLRLHVPAIGDTGQQCCTERFVPKRWGEEE